MESGQDTTKFSLSSFALLWFGVQHNRLIHWYDLGTGTRILALFSVERTIPEGTVGSREWTFRSLSGQRCGMGWSRKDGVTLGSPRHLDGGWDLVIRLVGPGAVGILLVMFIQVSCR